MPTTCNALTGILKSCDNNIGGIKKVWLWDMDDKVSSTPDPLTWFYSAYALSAPADIVGYDFIRNGSNYTEEATIDLANGSTFTTTNLNLMFTRREAVKSQEIMVLAEGQRYLGALVLDSNGLYWLFEDLQLSASTEGSGTAKADGSKYNLTFLGETPVFAREVAPADAALLISTGVF
jgi:hypothetical protein